MIADETPQAAARRLWAAMIAKGYKPAGLNAYRNANGVALFYRIRLKHPETGEKWIRPMYHDGLCSFVLGEPPTPVAGKPLYFLPELLADAGPVYVVEGEACADALSGLGVIATTSGGADSADAADWSPCAVGTWWSGPTTTKPARGTRTPSPPNCAALPHRSNGSTWPRWHCPSMAIAPIGWLSIGA